VKAKAETEAAIVEAQKHILEAHAERLTAELVEAKETGKPPARVDEFKWPFSFNRDPTGSVSGDDVATPNALPAGSRLNEGSKTVVTYDDIVAGRAPRPRVLDMFAGGGASGARQAAGELARRDRECRGQQGGTRGPEARAGKAV